MKIIKDIKSWWKYKGRYIVSDFTLGIKNIIEYFNIIWKDRDWDHSCILYLLEFKLRKQAQINKTGYAIDSERTSEIMILCANLCEKVSSEYYILEYLDYHESEYNFIDCDKPGYKELEIIEISNNYSEYFKKYKNTYRKIKESNGYSFIKDISTDNSMALAIAHYNHDRARNLLFKILSNKIETFWD